MRIRVAKFDSKFFKLCIVLAAFSVFLIFFRPITLSIDRAILSVTIFWIGLYPVMRAISVPSSEREPLPFRAYVGLFYAVFFGLSAFLDGVLRSNIYGRNSEKSVQFFGDVYVTEINIKAQIISIVGIFFLFFCWNISRTPLTKMLPRFTFPTKYSQTSLHILIWCLIIAHLLFVHIPYIKSIPSIGQFLQPSGYVGLAFMLHMAYSGNLPKWQKYIYFFIALPLWFHGLFFLNSLVLLLTPLVLAFGLWVGIHYFHRGAIPWRVITVFGVLFLGIYSTKNLYVMWANHPLASLETKVKFIGSMLRSSNPSQTPSLEGLYRRSGLIYTLSYVVEKTPSKIPHWEGVTLKPILTSWVPRILWPGKQQEKLGYEFGVRYSLIQKTDTEMSYNLPWLTELYVNFGAIGVILGMSVIGLFLSALETIFISRSQSYPEVAIGSAIILPLCFQEQNISVMIGSIVPLALSLWLYFTVGFLIFKKVLKF